MCHSGIDDHKVIIKKLELLSKNIVSIWLTSENINFEPGQFLMLEVPGMQLRRPFVIVDKNEKDIRIIFKIRGQGTKVLSELKVGTELKALAPLGNPFPPMPDGYKPLLVGGGIGIVTLLPLAKMFEKKCSASVILGADTKESLILLNEFGSCSKTTSCTDDGSMGEKCSSVELAKRHINKNPDKYIIYACGPTPMLKATAELAKQMQMPCFVSLEERMACGVGACVCCAVRTNSGIKRVCKDGPVFDAKDLVWEF